MFFKLFKNKPVVFFLAVVVVISFLGGCMPQSAPVQEPPATAIPATETPISPDAGTIAPTSGTFDVGDGIHVVKWSVDEKGHPEVVPEDSVGYDSLATRVCLVTYYFSGECISTSGSYRNFTVWVTKVGDQYFAHTSSQ